MKTKSIMQNFKKIILVTTLFIASLLAGSPAIAWGPERQTFTAQNAAGYVTFNSITDNTFLGDERNFVRIREAGVGNYGDEVVLVPGKTYEVYTYFHNNAKSSLNASGVGIAKNVRMKANLPTTVKAGERGVISSVIMSDNANPVNVWDEAYMTTTQTVTLRYVPNSAIIDSNGAVKGKTLPDALFVTGGTKLGYDSLNGQIPGCVPYSGSVVYKFTVDKPDFTVNKTVSKQSANDFKQTLAINAGDTVDYKITFKNTGNVTLNNVVIKDVLPSNMTYVKGSAKLNNSTLNDSLVSGSGVNIGNVAVGATATVTFKAKASSADKLTCGANNLKNVVSATASSQTKSGEATVTINKDCTPEEKCKIPGKEHLPANDPGCKKDPCTVPGKENLDADDPNCKEDVVVMCTVPGKEHLPANDPGCEETDIPGELPQTGPMEAILAILAILAITIGVVYWYNSYRAIQMAKAGPADGKVKNQTETTSNVAEPKGGSSEPVKKDTETKEPKDKK